MFVRLLIKQMLHNAVYKDKKFFEYKNESKQIDESDIYAVCIPVDAFKELDESKIRSFVIDTKSNLYNSIQFDKKE